MSKEQLFYIREDRASCDSKPERINLQDFYSEVIIVCSWGEETLIKIRLDEDGSVPQSNGGDSTEGDEVNGDWCIPHECVHPDYAGSLTVGGRDHAGIFCYNAFSQADILSKFTQPNKDKPAKQLKSHLKDLGHDNVPLGHCYELIARMNGFKSRNHEAITSDKSVGTYMGWCEESITMRTGDSYESVCPLVIDGEEYEEGFHLLYKGNIVGYCHEIFVGNNINKVNDDQKGFTLEYSYTEKTDVHNWKIFRKRRHVGWLHLEKNEIDAGGSWPGGSLDDELMEDHFDYVSGLASVDYERRKIKGQKIDMSLIPESLKNK